MKKETFFKVVALGAMVVGGVAIAKATTARIRRERDEAAAANAMVEAEIIAENFSGYGGRKRVVSGAKGDIVLSRNTMSRPVFGGGYIPQAINWCSKQGQACGSGANAGTYQTLPNGKCHCLSNRAEFVK